MLPALLAGDSPFGPSTAAWLVAVPLLPLIAWVIQACFGRFLPRQGDWLPTGAMGLAAVIAVVHLVKVLGLWDADFLLDNYVEGGLPQWKWFFSDPELTEGVAGFQAGILYDNLGAILLAMVAVVSFLIHLFSVGYMQGDSRYNIFFSNLPLFTFAMLALVLSDNLVFFFIFWEIMGLCSYLLIGHYSHDRKAPRMTAARASLKAFMTTRIGDVCLFIGMAILWAQFGTLSFHGLYQAVADVAAGGAWPPWLTAAGILMFLGAVGKSAQFPLHVWLPDAMEGPTPVSAMIHAATMVSAGVYLTGRIFLLASPEAQVVIACVGGFTALFAATMGITAFDIKKVLAYSTISQLGYMICAIGTGVGVAAGLFHVFTHAIFKACLFLGSGSVIHGCHHEQDMRKMGGLRKKMPITYATMLVSTLSIAGVPLFAGFYSKDAIVASPLQKYLETHELFWLLPFGFLVTAAVVTAFYMFRLIFMTFHGMPRDHSSEHAHESPWSMTVPLIVLGTIAVVGGKFWLTDPVHAVSGGRTPWFLQLVHNPELESWTTASIDEAHGSIGGHGAFLAGAAHGAEGAEGAGGAQEHGAAADDHGGGHGEAAHQAHGIAMIVSILAAGTGILLACLFYLWNKLSAARIAAALGGVYRLVAANYRFDPLYQATVIRGTMVLSAFMAWFDKTFIDGIVNAAGRLGKSLGSLAAATDSGVVDGAVNWVADTTSAASQAVRRMQTGRIQQYAYFTFAGAVLLAAFVLLRFF